MSEKAADDPTAMLALTVTALATVVEEVLESMWTRQEPDANRIGRMRVLIHVARLQAELLGRPGGKRG